MNLCDYVIDTLYDNGIDTYFRNNGWIYCPIHKRGIKK